MKKKSFLKKLWRFLVDNYFLAIFFASIAFVGVVSIYKLFFVKPTYVYVKVKVGQGLWWASTQKPSIWFVEGLKQAQKEAEKELTGQPAAKILSIRYYPSYIANQYDVYLIMRLKVTRLGKTGKYNFKRSAIGVASPVDFEFPSIQFSGTVLQISEKPIQETLTEKIIYLNKTYAYPWEFDGIKIGDRYFDGEENVVEILDKYVGDTAQVLVPFKSIIEQETPQSRRNVTVKLKIKGKQEKNNFIFGEEQVVALGKPLNLSTDNFQFQDYVVTKIE